MDIRKIKRLIELLDESGVNEIEIHEGEESVRITRAAAQLAAAPAPVAPAPPAPAPAQPAASEPAAPAETDSLEIGRASCRERVFPVV